MTKTIYSIILRNLKRMLAVTLIVSAFLILAYTVISFKQTEAQATRFVMNHVQRLAQAGVNSQNVGDIDLEIARFAQTWKETQDLALRIDIYLNRKLVSHAGQLQPFGRFSTLTQSTLELPSGNTLLVEIQIGLGGFIVYSCILLVLFEGAILALFYVLNKSVQTAIKAVTDPLGQKVEWIKKIASDLPASARATNRPDPTGIAEIDDLGESIASLSRQIVALENNLARVNFDRGRLKMAEQVAHSIKGVIATLQLKAGQIPLESESERKGIVDCIETLRDISGDLLKSKRVRRKEAGLLATKEPIHLMPVLRSAVETKREQFRDSKRVVIDFSGGNSGINDLALVNASELQGALFSLIDNAVEALSVDGGEVEIGIRSENDFVEILIRDNGRGVPESVLPSLMTENFSYGKENGNGIGLFHAKEVVEAANGSITIDSKEGIGTTVALRFPMTASPSVQIGRISLRAHSTLVCVDDDPLIHSIWKLRLKDVSPMLSLVVHLKSVSEFETWMSSNGPGEFGERSYLLDFDLKDQKNGLDLIENHGIALESVLVSGMVSDSEVTRRARSMGVRCLAKDSLSSVAIEVTGHEETERKSTVQVVL
jgi:signal transduction histidine kinase